MTLETLSKPSIEQQLLFNKEKLRRGPPAVIKIGGIKDVAGVINSLAFLQKEIGMKFVLVHGGGSEIDEELQQKGIIPEKINGLRVTDKETLKIVVSVLDRINGEMVKALRQRGVPAVAYDSTSRMIIATKKDDRLGFVGEVSFVYTGKIVGDLQKGNIPVVSPIGVLEGNKGQFLNINGDESAGAIAGVLGSNLVLVTKVPGVLDSSGKLIKRFDPIRFRRMQERGVIIGGMIPKLEAISTVVASGARGIICQASDFKYAFSEYPRGTVSMPEQ